MKRTCNGCRALGAKLRGNPGYGCDLGYPIGTRKKLVPSVDVPMPLVECPKPRTYGAFFGADRYEPPKVEVVKGVSDGT